MLLTRDEIEVVLDAAIASGLFESGRRSNLFAGLPGRYIASLPVHAIPHEQLRSDLEHMVRTPALEDGTDPPLSAWLGNASLAIGSRRESAVFRDLRTLVVARQRSGAWVQRGYVGDGPTEPGWAQRTPRLTPDNGELLVGTVLGGRYPLLELIGQGGSGAFYRSTRYMSAGAVGVKVLYSLHPETVARVMPVVERAVRAQMALSHPHVAAVFDFGLHTFGPPAGAVSIFIVQALQEGVTLDRLWSAPEPPTFAQRLLTMRQVVDAVLAAHDVRYVGPDGLEVRGLRHGDLTPANIIVTDDGDATVVDFLLPDLQRAIFGDGSALDPRWSRGPAGYRFEPYTTGAFGTPGFMPPEQAADGVVLEASDVYTLGLTTAIWLFRPVLPPRFNIRVSLDWWWSKGRRDTAWLEALAPDDRAAARILHPMLVEMTQAEPARRHIGLEAVGATLDEALRTLGHALTGHAARPEVSSDPAPRPRTRLSSAWRAVGRWFTRRGR